jgi:hypothetical protein
MNFARSASMETCQLQSGALFFTYLAALFVSLQRPDEKTSREQFELTRFPTLSLQL